MGRRWIGAAAALALCAGPAAAGADRTGTTTAPLLSLDGSWSGRRTVRLSAGPDGTVGGLSWLYAYPVRGPVVAEICVGGRCLETDRTEAYDDRSLNGAPLGPVTVRFRTRAAAGDPGAIPGAPVRITVTVEDR